MGVDWLPCGICNETFPDCGDYGTCASCEDDLCSNCHREQLSKYGTVDKDSREADKFGEDALSECDSCTESIIRDEDVIVYLLTKVGMTRERVVAEIKSIKSE